MSNDPIKPDPNQRLGRISKNAAFLTFTLVVFFLFMQSIRGEEGAPARVTYSQFIEYLDQGLVHRVTFLDRAIEGEFTQPITIAVSYTHLTLPTKA